MKKIKFFLPIMAMLLMSISFVGCNPHEDVDPLTLQTTIQKMQNVVGTYNGKIIQKTYYTNSTTTDEFTGYMKMAIDPKSNNYVIITEAAYNHGTWASIDYPTGLFNITGSNGIYTLKNINSDEYFTVTTDGTLTITIFDDRDSKGLGIIQTFTGTK